ncbi:MAG: autotransporter outer membrane beta-barrel domain-containing protein [Psychrilyobacter sp.]|nr:autotransporter outer membrane beta-barrel domain-containing protein [Psychrilyobacter sp.]
MFIGLFALLTAILAIDNEGQKAETKKKSQNLEIVKVEEEKIKSEINLFLNVGILDGKNSGKGEDIKWFDEKNIISKPLFVDGGDQIYGLDIMPNMARQTYDLISNNNRILTDYIINNPSKLEVGEHSFFAGVDGTFSSNGGYDNVLGYSSEIENLTLAMDYKVHPQLRIGGGLSLGKSMYDFKDSKSEREDLFFQGNFFLDHINDEKLRFTSLFYLGGTKADLERHYTAVVPDEHPNLNPDKRVDESATSDFGNFYIGLNNQVSKRYDIEKSGISFYYEPRFQINMTYLMQGGIDEESSSKEFDGLNIEKEDSYSLYSGAGIALGKDFKFKNDTQLNLELGVDVFAEMGNKYKELTNDKNFVDRKKAGKNSGKHNTIKGYDSDYITLSTSFRGGYDINESFSLYSGINYDFGENEKKLYGNLGFNYSF